MRKKLLLGMTIATVTTAIGAGSASAATLTYEGGPVMSSARWVEVVWGSGLSTENSTLAAHVASYLTDDAADSGKTTNVFALDAQYSTVGLTGGSNQILAYDQSFAGSTEISPTSCPSATKCEVTEGEIETELKSQIAAAHISAPSADGMTTVYIVLFPSSITVVDNNAAKSGVAWCSEHGSTTLSGGTHLIFAMVPDLGASGGCGETSNTNENDIISLSHQQNEILTDPLVAQSQLAWYDNNSSDIPGYGEIGDICAFVKPNYGVDTINGHSWDVQKEWSNADGNCVASTGIFHAPIAGFTVTPSVNTAAFSASGESSNQLAKVPAAIASYSWDFGDGQSGTGQNPTHAYTAAGNYTVTLTATDSLGFTAHASHQVTVSAPPPGPGAGGSGSTSTTGTPSTTSPPPVATLAQILTAGAPLTSAAGGGVLVSSGQSIQCPASGGLCVVTIQATVDSAHAAKKHKTKSHKLVVGSATLTVSPGATAKVTFKLNGLGKRLLKAHGHLLVKLTVTVRHGSDAPVVSTRTLRLSAPKHHGRK